MADGFGGTDSDQGTYGPVGPVAEESGSSSCACSAGPPGPPGPAGPAGPAGGLEDIGVWVRATNAIIQNDSSDDDYPFQVADKDTSGFWNPAFPTMVTIPAGQAGTYLITGYIPYLTIGGTFAGDKGFFARITVNAAARQGGQAISCVSFQPPTFHRGIIERLEVGDEVRIRTLNSTGAQRIYGTDAQLKLQKLFA